MASTKGRIVNSWNFPEGRLMKAIAVRLYDKGLRGQELEEAFNNLLPRWQTYFSKPISSSAIVQRANKARRYDNEAPENNPAILRYWSVAPSVVKEGKRLTKRDVRQIIRTVP